MKQNGLKFLTTSKDLSEEVPEFSHQDSTCAFILMDMGSLNSPRTAKRFLNFMFKDPRILPLPKIFRFFLSLYITRQRFRNIVQNYAQLPGKSPVWHQTHDLAQKLSDRAAGAFIKVCFRYTPPYASHIIRSIKQKKKKRVILLPLFPLFSYTTTQSSIDAWKETLQNTGISLGVCPPFYNHPFFIKAWGVQTRRILTERNLIPQDGRFIFCFHSLPLSLIQKTGDPYLEQARELCALLSKELGITDAKLAFQSPLSKKGWLSPYFLDVLAELKGLKAPIILIGLSFATENGETLLELDHTAQAFAKKNGLTLIRIPIPVQSPLWLDLFEDLLKNSQNISEVFFPQKP